MNIIKKIIYVVIGSVIAAFGIDLAIYAGFGGATQAVYKWQHGTALPTSVSKSA